MSGNSYQWGDEHFCEPDVVRLNDTDPDLKLTHGYPVQLETNPVPPTFCSSCLNWFDDPAHDTQHTGSAHRPPTTEGHSNG